VSRRRSALRYSGQDSSEPANNECGAFVEGARGSAKALRLWRIGPNELLHSRFAVGRRRQGQGGGPAGREQRHRCPLQRGRQCRAHGDSGPGQVRPAPVAERLGPPGHDVRDLQRGGRGPGGPDRRDRDARRQVADKRERPRGLGLSQAGGPAAGGVAGQEQDRHDRLRHRALLRRQDRQKLRRARGGLSRSRYAQGEAAVDRRVQEQGVRRTVRRRAPTCWRNAGPTPRYCHRS